MVKVLGDQVPVTFPDTEVDVYLFLDITKQEWNQIKLLDPTRTYIITTKSIWQCQTYIALGFYNIVFEVSPTTVTKKFILGLLNTKYEDNRLKLVIDHLIPLYKENGNTVGCISELLKALKNCDLETLRRLVTYNTDSMLSSLDKLGTMFILADSLGVVAEPIQELRAKVASAEAKLAEFGLLQTKLTTAMTENEDLRQNIEILQKEHGVLQNEMAHRNESAVTTVVDIKETPAYQELLLQKDQVSKELSELKAAYYRLEITAGIVADGDDTLTDSKDRVITMLRKQIHEMQNLDYATELAKKLPLVTNAMSLKAETILYLKEIKPQIYINSLVFWLQNHLSTSLRGEHKTYLILVFDSLQSEYALAKYKSRKWAINEPPNSLGPIVITNNISMGFLKNRVLIDQYDFLLVIDRLGNMRDIFETSKTQKFYLINTVNDVKNFHLDRNRCIGFFDQQDNEYVKYHIPPYDEKLITDNTVYRAYKHLKDKVFSRILVELGVVKNE